MKKRIILLFLVLFAGCSVKAEKYDEIKIGNYSAKLVDAEWGDEIQKVIDNKDSAGHNVTGTGIEYIADHSYQGFGQCIWNDELEIYRNNGAIDTYHKLVYFEKPSNDGTWEVGDTDIYMYEGADLLTQVCRGEGIYWAFWERID